MGNNGRYGTHHCLVDHGGHFQCCGLCFHWMVVCSLIVPAASSGPTMAQGTTRRQCILAVVSYDSILVLPAVAHHVAFGHGGRLVGLHSLSGFLAQFPHWAQWSGHRYILLCPVAFGVGKTEAAAAAAADPARRRDVLLDYGVVEEFVVAVSSSSLPT